MGVSVRSRLTSMAVLAAVLVLALASIASADSMLGSTSAPSGSSVSGCGGGVIAESASDAATPYTVPAAGQLTHWQINTVSATAGAPVTLVVLRAAAAGSYTVVGVDSQTLPNPLPAGGIAAFTVASPIAVQSGDILGLYTSGTAVCYFNGGSTPSGNSLIALTEASTPAAGQTLPVAASSGGGYELNLEATLVTQLDLGVTLASSPATPTVGSLAVISATVSDAGPSPGSATFTDAVPAGLTIDSAVAGSGTCSVSGQTVTCTISGLAAGASSPVTIIVTPTATGSYANSASVATVGTTDPNAANNSASATLTVAPALVTAKCTVPKLRGLTVSLARQLLGALGCAAGPVKHVASRTVPRGLVAGTSPGPSTGAAGLQVTIDVSSGPPKKKHHHA
jgi:hypothetical protein